MSGFNFATDSRGVATITWDIPDKSMNILNFELLEKLDGLVDRVLCDDGIKGAVITSGKPDFSGGMDLNTLAALKASGGDKPAQRIFDGTMELHRILRRIETGGSDPKAGRPGKPFAAALTGTALGIGIEVALACHRVFAADRPEARIGFPEIRLGLFPGGGGTTRLVRMLGLMRASTWLFEGRTADPARAADAGLINEVVPAAGLAAAAGDWVAGTAWSDAVKPWDARGYRIPGGAPYQRDGFPVFTGAAAQVHGRTRGVYPAAKALLSAIYEGSLVPFDTALRIEARWFTKVMMNPSSAAMINTLFVNKRALDKGPAQPAGADAPRVRALGIIGAGMMGAGIGHVAAAAGIPVVLVDRDRDTAERGRAVIGNLMEESVQRGRMTADRKAELLSGVAATDRYRDLADCDLVIEAVFEDPGVKARVIAAAAEAVAPGTVIATNTSTLPISELSQSCPDGERFLGMHFFSPVHKMMLLEIIRGRDTGAPAVETAVAFSRQVRKTPIVVNDARFFYANRCVIPYINEGVRMVAEGVRPALVENAARSLGMPVGPLQLVDETSLDLGVAIAKASRAALGAKHADSPAETVMERLVELGRLGRKSGAGFYAYDGRGRRQGLWAGLGENWPIASGQPGVATVRHRLLLIQVLEAVRTLEDGVLRDIREGDVGAILGWGFAPWSGGPFTWLDTVGADEAVSICDRLSEQLGDRFSAPGLLRKMAGTGETFHGRFAGTGTAT